MAQWPSRYTYRGARQKKAGENAGLNSSRGVTKETNFFCGSRTYPSALPEKALLPMALAHWLLDAW